MEFIIIQMGSIWEVMEKMNDKILEEEKKKAVKPKRKKVKIGKGKKEPVVKPDVKEKRSWICEECGQTFTVKRSLEDHMHLHRYAFGLHHLTTAKPLLLTF